MLPCALDDNAVVRVDFDFGVALCRLFFGFFDGFGFLFFADGIAEGADFSAQTVIRAMRVADRLCTVEMELACFI